jgi:aldehyde dehydrogenase (NAD+)
MADSVNPCTGEKIAESVEATPADVDSAVKAAGSALGAWKALSGHARAKYLYAIARGLQKHSKLLSVLEAMDNGKTIRETRDLDVPLAVRHFYHHAGWAQVRDSEVPGYEPVGVVGAIIPWNFPLLMLSWKVAPALAMGCTVVLKPAPSTRLTAWAFCQICLEAGLPPGKPARPPPTPRPPAARSLCRAA